MKRGRGLVVFAGMPEVFADAVYAVGSQDSSAIALPGPENRVTVRLDRSRLALLPDAPCARVELWVAEDGVTRQRLIAFDLNGGEGRNPRTGEVVTHAEVYDLWVPGRGVATRKFWVRLRSLVPMRCSVTFDAAEGPEPSGGEDPHSVAHVLAGSAGTSGVTGVTQSITVGSETDRVLLAFTGVDDNESSDPSPAVVFNTTETLTQVATLLVDIPGAQDLHMRIHRRIAPSATTADLVWSGMQTAHRWGYAWAVAQGVDQTTPEGTAGTGSGTSGDTLSGSCTGVTDGLSYGLGFVLRSGSPTIADGGGQTARTETEGIASRVAISVATIAGSGTNSYSWTAAGGGSTQGWGVIALPLNPSAGAATTPKGALLGRTPLRRGVVA